MSLSLLFRDELNGFYRSKVMMALWVGLPVMAVALYFLVSETEGIPMSQFTALLVGSIGGLLTSAMIVVTILKEKEERVYDLFLVRPVKRRDLLLSKFLAIYLCVIIAALLAIVLSASLDAVINDHEVVDTITGLGDSVLIALSMMAISCSVGLLIGVISNSMLVGILLVLYGGNQLSSLVILPIIMDIGEIWMAVLLSAAITSVMLICSILLFQRKEL
ncbi:MAG: ABC transporter permease [Methanomassiliicoccales archaeon]|nr:ABC transporter permease [Methanomassiliicoccales archaeon]